MNPQTVTVTVTEKQCEYLAISVAVAAIAGVIPKDEAWDLVDLMYARHIQFIRDIQNGEQ